MCRMIIHFHGILAFTMIIMDILTIYFIGRTFPTLNDDPFF